MNHFYSTLARMKHIRRWGTMRNTWEENLAEHSLQVAMISHALALIGNKQFNRNCNPERTAVLAIFHDSEEIFTGDVITPIKHFNSEVLAAHRSIENIAKKNLLDSSPSELKPDYQTILFPTKEDQIELLFVKAADRISALIKCTEELEAGNKEFKKAEQSIRKDLEKLNLAEVNWFLKESLPGFKLSMDEIENE